MSLSLQFAHSGFLTDYKIIYGHYIECSIVTFDTALPSDQTIVTKLTSPQYPYLFLTESGVTQGYSYLYPHGYRRAYQYSVNYGVYLSPHSLGKGFGTLLSRKIIQLAGVLGFMSLYSAIAVPNPESEALQNKLCLKLVGDFPRSGYKFDQWIDVKWYYKGLGEAGNDDPGPILTTADLTDRQKTQILDLK